jgi:hypothetical protein
MITQATHLKIVSFFGRHFSANRVIWQVSRLKALVMADTDHLLPANIQSNVEKCLSRCISCSNVLGINPKKRRRRICASPERRDQCAFFLLFARTVCADAAETATGGKERAGHSTTQHNPDRQETNGGIRYFGLLREENMG